MSILDLKCGEKAIIKDIQMDNEEVKAFLFTLGCYSGEEISLIANNKKTCTVMIKDTKYSIDLQIASAIII